MKKYRGVFIKNEQEIDALRCANGIVSYILDEIGQSVRPGVTTQHFEEIAQKICKDYKVQPSFQGYQGYPFALCCSHNEVIVHGFPSDKCVLKEGDIISVDMGVVYKGFHGDSARTFLVGTVSEQAQRLSRITEESLHLGINAAQSGNELYSISAAVQKHAEGAGYHVIQRFVGHGVGARLHEKPEVPNFVPRTGMSLPLKAGMVLAIEPMLALGTHEVEILSDGWTAVTRDRSLAAHWEHSVAIHGDRTEILSLSENRPKI